MGIGISVETNSGKHYHLEQRMLIDLFMTLDLYCHGDEESQHLQLIEPYFDHQACAILGPIINAHYPQDWPYTEHDFELFARHHNPRADGYSYTEEDFLKEHNRITKMWQDITHYRDVIKRLMPAIEEFSSLYTDQDSVSKYGPSVLEELLNILELAAREGTEKVRINWA